MPSLEDAIRATALELGFDSVGIARADSDLDPERRVDAWLAQAMHGAMGYLERTGARRADPRTLLPAARSIVAVACRYPAAAATDSIAAYARLDDYHLRMVERLRALLERVQSLAAGTEGLACVDTRPLLERAAAARAGLGWVGKNTMLMSVERGPWLMLGALLLSLDLAPDAPQPERCGTCSRCLDACPTNAFVAPWTLDARRCLSYWTIEHRGPWPIEFREKVGGRVFGCDDCLTACPFPRHRDGTPSRLLPIAPELAALHPRDVLRRCEESFNRWFKRYAIQRAGKRGLVRNAITALGNVGSRDDLAAIERYRDDPDAGIREHARWAIGRIESRETLRA